MNLSLRFTAIGLYAHLCMATFLVTTLRLPTASCLRGEMPGTCLSPPATAGRVRVCPNVGCPAVQLERPQSGRSIGEAAGRHRPKAAVLALTLSASEQSLSVVNIQRPVLSLGLFFVTDAPVRS